ncbi:MAG: FHA domain-containing protein [Limisphaerales bacterium]
MHVLTGKKTGAVALARRFPWRIGRAPDADLRLEEDGIWERHLELTLHHPEGFRLSLKSEALATINGRPIQETTLHNGDLIELGPVKIRFWLSEPRQHSLRPRECFTWLLLAGLSVAQIALVYWLQR